MSEVEIAAPKPTRADKLRRGLWRRIPIVAVVLMGASVARIISLFLEGVRAHPELMVTDL